MKVIKTNRLEYDLVAYGHIDKKGIQKEKPNIGFAYVRHVDGSLGAIDSTEIANWDKLPYLTST